MSSADIVGVDAGAVSRWLETLGVDFAGPLTFDRIGLGQSNLTYLVRDQDGRSWVLRRPPLGRLLASAHDVAREARILTALEGTAVPTPRVLGLTADPAVTDVPLLLMEFVDGQVVDTMPIAQSLTPERRRAIGMSLPRTLAKIYAVDLEATGLTGLASHKPYAQRQLKRWTGQWAKSRTRELPALEDLTRRLVAAVPEQCELTLVHGDFHLRNVITSYVSGEVTAALDWELSTLGDPLADMGSLLAYWPEPGEEETGGDFAASVLDGFPNRDELAHVYLTETGRDPAALTFWHVLGLWKVAVIAEGVMRRAIDEPKNKTTTGTPPVCGAGVRWPTGVLRKDRGMRQRQAVTVGVDLAASARRTAVCRVVWGGVDGLAAEFVVPEGDEDLLAVVRAADKTGLDCPLGWPSSFVATVLAHHRGLRLPPPVRFEERADGRPGLDALRFRFTDDLTWKATSMRPPLSVSTDLLGVVALRAAYLLDALAAIGAPVPRDGSGPIAEVYPAAALRRWGIRLPGSYKSATPEARAVREHIVGSVEAGLGLALPEAVRGQCVNSHDHLDALVCALVARAVLVGDTLWPCSPDERTAAGQEGWIHLPGTDLAALHH